MLSVKGVKRKQGGGSNKMKMPKVNDVKSPLPSTSTTNPGSSALLNGLTEMEKFLNSSLSASTVTEYKVKYLPNFWGGKKIIFCFKVF